MTDWSLLPSLTTKSAILQAKTKPPLGHFCTPEQVEIMHGRSNRHNIYAFLMKSFLDKYHCTVGAMPVPPCQCGEVPKFPLFGVIEGLPSQFCNPNPKYVKPTTNIWQQSTDCAFWRYVWWPTSHVGSVEVWSDP